MAMLQAYDGIRPGRRYVLRKERSILGRHPDCDVVLEAGAVSRQHAQILHLGADFYVEDLGSRNGTFVNGDLIQGRHKLEPGDEVKICELLFSFEDEDAPSRPPRSTTRSTIHLPLVMEEDLGITPSSIVSKLDVSSQSGMRVAANPQAKLQALLEITQNLGRALALDDVLPKVLEALFKIFVQADRGFVAIKNDAGVLVPKAVKYRRGGSDDTIRISRTIVNQAMESREAILSADASNDSRFDMSQSIVDFRIRSLMCVPLLGGDGEALGVIQVDTLDQRARFQSDDLEVLASVASQAAVAVENAQLHDLALQQQAMERDLELAHKVQQGLLPLAAPKIEGYEFFDFYEPAYQVGGDYFDYVELPGGRFGVILADVSGKGVAAALLMAKLSGEMRYALASETNPAAAVQRVNAAFSHSRWEDRFVTLVLVLVDPQNHQMSVVNAGHMPPLVRRSDGSVEELGGSVAGVPLGVDPTFAYEQASGELAPGDLVVMFTDGISEAMNGKGELFGIERLRKRLQGPSKGVAQYARGLLDDVKRFVGDRDQSDDICLTCFVRLA